MPRTMTITLEVVIDHLPTDQIDDIESMAEDFQCTHEKVAEDLLAEAEDGDVAECLLQGIYSEENCAGSGLYLRVNDAKIVGMKWQST